MQNKTFKQIHFSAQTHQGMIRKINEDSICLDNNLNLYVVADGMGGHQCGEIASKKALFYLKEFIKTKSFEIEKSDQSDGKDFNDDATVTEFEAAKKKTYLSDYKLLDSAIKYANQKIYNLNKENNASKKKNMGTTIAGIYINDESKSALIFHVGDSRVYRFRSDKLIQLTLDHSLYEKWKREGMKGKAPGTNIITKAIGPYENIEPAISKQSILTNDIFLICSDGLTDLVSDDQIFEMLKKTTSENINFVCKKFITMANDNGGKDNISAIIVTFT